MRFCIYVNLSHYETFEVAVRRAQVHLNTTAAEDALANAMHEAILSFAPYHEAGTLWMGTDPQTSVTDVNGRIHKVANAFCADQSLFVTVGSVNPTLTGLVLTREVAQAAGALATGTSAPA